MYYSLINVKELKTPLFTFRAVPYMALQKEWWLFHSFRGFTPGQSEKSLKKMQTSISKSGRPLEKELSIGSSKSAFSLLH